MNMKLEDYSLRLEQLLSEIEAFKGRGWVRDEHFRPWIDKFNAIVSAFNSDFGRQVPHHGISHTSYSKSGKTITSAAIDSLASAIVNLKGNIDDTLKRNAEDAHRFHCFKINHKCPHSINPRRYLFFVGMPFDDQYKDSYEFGIKTMLDGNGVNTETQLFRADEKFSSTDIMCKICRAIQESQYILINISGQNPNVMFELGLAYGLNKKVFLLKDKQSAEVTDLKGLEYIEYAHAGDLARKLRERLSDLGII